MTNRAGGSDDSEGTTLRSAPVPVGELSMRDGVAYLSVNVGKIPPGSTIAFTKEPGPGSKAPTLPVVSAGKLAG